MQITFIGVPGEDHQSITMYGHAFALGKPLSVGDETAVRKLSNHPHFKVEADKAKEEKAADIGTREDLIATAESLGVKVDKRWSNERLAAEIGKS